MGSGIDGVAMSKGAWYRRIYGCGIGTGWRFDDGTEAMVGDLVAVDGTDKPGTIRVRSGSKSGRPYVTWWERSKVHTMSLEKMPRLRRYTKERYFNNVPVKKAQKPMITCYGRGEMIVGLEDYDHAITITI